MAETKGLILAVISFMSLYAGLVSSSSNNVLQAVFSMGGIKGDVIFSQPQDNGPTGVMVNLKGINETLKWSIQQLPMIYDGNAAMSCSANAVGTLFDPKMAMKSADYNTQCSSNKRFEACAIGDLGRMLGDLTQANAQTNHTNQNMMIPTRGPHSIMGRTLVLYSGNTPKACALITPTRSMLTAVAVFKAPLAGFVYLRQVDENTDTTVFVDLFFVNDAQASEFTWQINQGVVDLDSSDPPTYCKTLGERFNPKNSNGVKCNQTMQGNCPIGDLTSKHGNIVVSVATSKQSKNKSAFTDTNLPLSGLNTVIGESIVLFSVKNPGKPVACAKILTLQPKELKVSFMADSNDGVNGYFKFTQASPFDPTTSEINLRGLGNKAQGYHIHAYPSPEFKHLKGNDSCSGLIAGDHWNPLNIDIKKSPAAGTGTSDEYEIGDLSGKYGSFLNLSKYDKQHKDYNLPLFGRNSIQGRSLVIHKLKKDGNKRWVCNNLELVVDARTSYVMKGTANFTGPTLTGVILMDQYFSSVENTAAIESTIYIEVNYMDPQANPTDKHMWNVHKYSVGEDGRTEEVSKRCLGLQEIFNPYNVDVKGSYDSACSPTNMLRCESGDLTKKHAFFTVSGGRQLYNDVSLQLFGRNSVIGRGVTVHGKNKESNSLGCANIVADSTLFVEKSLEFVTSDPFSEADFADVVSKALSIPKWRLFNIRTMEADVDKCQIAKFGIIGKGNQVNGPVKKLNDVLKSSPSDLGKYRPSKDCVKLVTVEPPKSGVRHSHVNFFTLAGVTMTTVVMEKLQLF